MFKDHKDTTSKIQNVRKFIQHMTQFLQQKKKIKKDKLIQILKLNTYTNQPYM